jgi:hypothetical protein
LIPDADDFFAESEGKLADAFTGPPQSGLGVPSCQGLNQAFKPLGENQDGARLCFSCLLRLYGPGQRELRRDNPTHANLHR